MRAILLLMALAHPLGLAAGTFELKASVDKTRLELGESLLYRVSLKAEGRMDFPPQLSIPQVQGFQMRGEPRQNQAVNWVNGAVTIENSWEWELVAMQAGTLSLGPVKAVAKHAGTGGEIVKTTPVLKITVTRPKAFAFPTPTPETDQPPGPDDDKLYDIMGDLGPPWARLGLVFIGFAGVLGALAWLAAARPKARPKAVVVRDPGQLALQELEKAREALKLGDEQGFVKEASRIFRFYLRHRLRAPEAQWTLGDCARRAEAKLAGSAGELAACQMAVGRLEALLYGGEAFQARDADLLYLGLRGSIVAMERDAAWEPLAGLNAALDGVAERRGAALKPDEAGPALKELRGLAREHLDGLIERAEEAVDGRVRLQARRQRLARDKVHGDLAGALARRGLPARRRLDLVLLAKAPHEAVAVDALVKDLKSLFAALEKGEEPAAPPKEAEA